MKKYPKISIVTPSYNQAQYLEETIKSVLEQNYPNLEYIIIDGGSTDASLEIIKKYEKHLAYWVSEKDRGQYHAINKGFKKSSGEIMAWINSDDKYHENSFFSVAEIFAEFIDVQWLQGANTHFDEAGRCVNVWVSRDWSKYNFYLGNYRWIQQESTFWRRELWDRAGGYVDDSLSMAGDYELWLRFFRYAKLYVVDCLIGGFRMRKSKQKTLELEVYDKEVSLVLKKELDSLDYDTKMRIEQIRQKKLELQSVTLSKKMFDGKNVELAALFEYPVRLIFDRFKQKFVFSKNI